MTVLKGFARESMSFAFSGCTPLSAASVRSLAIGESHFQDTLRVCDGIFAAEAGWTIRDTLERLPDGELLTGLPLTLPINVAVQVAMFRLLRSYGLDAGAVIGMSSGEIAAACAAEAISLRDALRIAVHAARFMESLAARFRMALIWLSASACVKFARSLRGHIAIAAVMAPGVTAISGEVDAVERMLGRLADAGVRSQALPFAWGVHTPLLREGRAAFEAAMRPVPTSPPRRRILSAAFGRWKLELEPSYWWQIFSRPVLFMPGVERMTDAGVRLFIEVGPTAAMSSVIAKIGAGVILFPDALAAAKRSAGSASPIPIHSGTAGA